MHKLGDAKAITPITEALQDTHYDVRSAAKEALAKLKKKNH